MQLKRFQSKNIIRLIYLNITLKIEFEELPILGVRGISMNRVFFSFYVIIAIMAIVLGCSGNRSSISPDLKSENHAAISNSTESNGHMCWGYYDITINPQNNSAEVIPLRIAEGHLNALKYLEKPWPKCLQIKNLTLVGEKTWLVDVVITHPFVGVSFYSGFDVRGIVMFDHWYLFSGSQLSTVDPDNSESGALLNPDGYTTLFNPTYYPPGSAAWPAWEYQKGKMATEIFPNSTLNPYKSFKAGSERHVFKCTDTDTVNYKIRFPKELVTFGYAVDASWAPPANNPPDVPDDFPISANMPEAYKLQFIPITNTLWSEPGVGNGGDIRFKIKVYDWQDAHRVADGGTVKNFNWEIPGLTTWKEIFPFDWEDGVDTDGAYVAYEFLEAPVPDTPGPHKCLIGVTDIETGIQDQPERAYIIENVSVAYGETCWSPGEMIAAYPSENYMAHLGNANSTFIDIDNNLHVFYLDPYFVLRHIIYNGGVISDEEVPIGTPAFNINAVYAPSGEIHLMYSDDPDAPMGGWVKYCKIDTSGTLGPIKHLSNSSEIYQFQNNLTLAPDGTMLATWQYYHFDPDRDLCAAYFNGSDWSPEMVFQTLYLPNGWNNTTVVADSKSVFHLVFNDGDPENLIYRQFDHGVLSDPETIIDGFWKSSGPILSIDPENNLFCSFEDARTGVRRGYLKIRDYASGQWLPEKDIIGHDYATDRFQNAVLPDGRLAVIWTDYREAHRSLFSKVFDPYLSAIEIQSIPDDEIDAPFTAQKNQTRLCLDNSGTLHLVWSDERSTHFQLYYSQCTP